MTYPLIKRQSTAKQHTAKKCKYSEELTCSLQEGRRRRQSPRCSAPHAERGPCSSSSHPRPKSAFTLKDIELIIFFLKGTKSEVATSTQGNRINISVSQALTHLRVEDVEDGSAVGDAVEQNDQGDGGHDDDAAVLRAIDRVRRGVAALLRRRQQRIPVQRKEGCKRFFNNGYTTSTYQHMNTE